MSINLAVEEEAFKSFKIFKLKEFKVCRKGLFPLYTYILIIKSPNLKSSEFSQL